MAILATALVALPTALSADVAMSWVNAAYRGPLGDLRPVFPQAGANSETADLGASGALPHDTTLSSQLMHDAGSQAALLSGVTGGGQASNLPSGPLGIPGVVLDAYLHAQQVMSVQEPGCHLPWWLLAGIGKIESGQAENGEVDNNGNTLRPILGPELNGSNGFAAIPATDGGKWTGDPVWSRAVGPMQFLPSTWTEYGGGGNPNNMYDAALAAGRYLCAGGRDLSVPANQAIAVFSYNHSDSYVRVVLIWADAYAQGVQPLPETGIPQGPVPPNTNTTPAGVLPPAGSITGTVTTSPSATTPTSSTTSSATSSTTATSSTSATSSTTSSTSSTSSTSTPPSSTTTPPTGSCTSTPPTSTTTTTTTTTPTPPTSGTPTPTCPTGSATAAAPATTPDATVSTTPDQAPPSGA